MPKKETEEDVNEANLMQLQLAEQSLQNLLLQKQVFQLELTESDNALEELKKTKDEQAFKIVGSLMLKSDKDDLKKDLKTKKDILNLRIKSIEKQEEDIKNKLIKARDNALKGLKKA